MNTRSGVGRQKSSAAAGKTRSSRSAHPDRISLRQVGCARGLKAIGGNMSDVTIGNCPVEMSAKEKEVKGN